VHSMEAEGGCLQGSGGVNITITDSSFSLCSATHAGGAGAFSLSHLSSLSCYACPRLDLSNTAPVET
jgi:hypothetical protein